MREGQDRDRRIVLGLEEAKEEGAAVVHALAQALSSPVWAAFKLVELKRAVLKLGPGGRVGFWGFEFSRCGYHWLVHSPPLS